MPLAAALRRLSGPALLAACSAAAAYEQAGHFYTAFALARTAQSAFPDRERLLVSLCAQLPDMASDLDAVTVYKAAAMANPWKWFRWASADVIDGRDLRRMITIQQLLHGLTGGRSKAVQQVAAATVDELARVAAAAEQGAARDEALCALGFALHLQGDSYAHEQIDDAGQPAERRRMYVTGRGHAGDWHDPDHVFCARYVQSVLSSARNCDFDEGPQYRFAAWRALWSGVGGVIDGLGERKPQAREPLLESLRALGRAATPLNQWNEGDMRQALGRRLDNDVVRLSRFIDRHEKDQQPCRKVLEDAASESLPPFTPGRALSCADAWDRFQRVVRARFAAAPAEARKALDGNPDFENKVYCTKPLDAQDC